MSSSCRFPSCWHLAGLFGLGAPLLAVPAVAATPTEVLTAMEVDIGSASNIASSSDPMTLAVFPALGPITPMQGADVGVMYTGNTANLPPIGYPPPVQDWTFTDTNGNPQPGCSSEWDTDLGFPGTEGDVSEIALDLIIPATANSLLFDFWFSSREFPEYVGSPFNDAFEVEFTGSLFTGQIVFDENGQVISVNNALFDEVYVPTNPANPDWTEAGNSLFGTGFDMDGGTGWLTTQVPVAPSETVHIEFSIHDEADGICDSVVLLDNVRFSVIEIEDPVTGDDDDSTGDDDDSTGDDDDSTGDDDDSAVLQFQGSGCSTNCESPGGLSILAFALMFGVGRRSRRERGFAVGRRARRAWPLLAVLLVPVVAEAQTNGPVIDIQRFDPIAQDRGFTLVRDGETSPRGRFSTAFSFNYALRPLEVGLPGSFQRQASVVENLFGFDLTAAYGATDWLTVGVQLPFLQLQANPDAASTLSALYGHTGGVAGLGDTTLSVAFGPLRQGAGHPLSFTIAPRVVLPTGSSALFVGSRAAGLGIDFAFGGKWKHFHLAGNIGFQVNTYGQAMSNLRPDDELRWGVGLGLPLAQDQVEIMLEWVGGAVIDPVALADIGAGPFDPVNTPSELDLGVQIAPKGTPVWFKLGVGRGIGPGFGGPDLRAFAMLGLDLDCHCKDVEPLVIEKIVEKIVQVEDPDPDRDGLLGTDDQCPHNPEDKDGHLDADGCPEWDNDIDTVHDATDRCPVEKEVLNGVDDTDGCPDTSLAQIDVEKQEIVILDKVYFDLDKDRIKKASYPVLDAVYAVMNDYKSITKVEIQGHTDSRAKDDYNLDLSQRRAAAVMKYLVGKGIAAERLTARGYGETQPINAAPVTEDDHSMNRRVQFLIVEAGLGSPSVKQVQEAKPTEAE